MKLFKRILKTTTALLMITALLMGCSSSKTTLLSTDEDFAFSYGIDKDGFWKNIKAKDNVELCDYIGIVIPKEIHEVSDEAIQGEIDSLMTNFTEENQITDREIINGDTVNIDYIGSIDGVPFEGGNTQGEGTKVTIGVTQYIDDFLEQLIGHMPGESFDIEVTFPDDYGNEELKGKDAVFAITLNYIIESVTPEVNDSFVAENLSAAYSWNTVSEMKEYIRENLQNSALEYFIQDYLVANSTIKNLPDLIVEYQEFSMIQYYRDYANYYSMTFEEFISASMGVSSMDELIETNLEQNKGTAGLYLILQAIAEDAKIKVKDEDAITYFSGLSQTGDYTQYETVYGMPHLKMIALQRAVLDYLKESVVLE